MRPLLLTSTKHSTGFYHQARQGGQPNGRHVAAKQDVRILALFAFIFSLVSCVPNDREVNPSGPVRVKIPVLGASGAYEMRTVQLETVDNLKVFGGSSARFFYSPGVEDNRIVGIQPSVKLGKDAAGVYFPLDALSLQILTIYYHSEKLREMDRALEIEAVTKWPKTIVLNAQIPGASVYVRDNNAFYWPDRDAMVFVPYTQSSLPISVNGGVIGHEHFHYIFESLIERQVKKQGMYEESKPSAAGTTIVEGNEEDGGVCSGTEGRKRYLLLLSRALNEGLADVWAWLYSGDTKFVERSLSAKGSGDEMMDATDPLCGNGDEEATSVKKRKLKGEVDRKAVRDLDSKVKGQIESCKCFHGRIIDVEAAAKISGQSRDASIGLAYHLGSRVAKVVKQFITGGATELKTYSIEDRRKVARGMLVGLSRIEKRVLALKEGEWVEPSELVSLVTQEMSFINPENCKYLQSKLGSTDRVRACGKSAGGK